MFPEKQVSFCPKKQAFPEKVSFCSKKHFLLQNVSFGPTTNASGKGLFLPRKQTFPKTWFFVSIHVYMYIGM